MRSPTKTYTKVEIRRMSPTPHAKLNDPNFKRGKDLGKTNMRKKEIAVINSGGTRDIARTKNISIITTISMLHPTLRK
jgi:hypothetical protein